MRLKTNPRAGNGVCAVRPEVAAKSCNETGRTLAALLTVSESRVLALVVFAKTNKEIARDLCISPATVKRHLENVLRKLGAKNRVEAAIYGLLLNGCSAGRDSDCPLEAWREASGIAKPIWAE